MCSIAGIISPSVINPQQLRAMHNTMRHRGPDGEGFYEHNGIGLAHHRLRVIDTSTASDQPFRYMDRYVLVYNGELYNYKALRQTLQSKGFHFNTDGDTEVIVAAYAAYGHDCLQHFDGIFAFAIWDEHHGKFFAARDRFGEKPFYYHYNKDAQTLFFASEIKALLAAGINASVNHALLYNYLTLGHTKQVAWPDNTFYEHIFQLPPSHFISMEAKQEPVVARYFDLDKEAKESLPEQEVMQRFSSLLHNAVHTRLEADVACGSSLSGGIDSSTIAAICNQGNNTSFSHRAFSAVFPGFAKDESAQINQVSQQCGLTSYTTTPSAQDMADQLKSLLYHQDEPFGSASVFAQWCVYKLAKEQGVTVLLDGQGADEVLGGYTKYTHWFLQEQIKSKGWTDIQSQAQTFRKNNFLDTWSWRNRVAAMLPTWTAISLKKRAIKQQEQNPYIDVDYRRAHADEDGIFKPTVDKLNDIQYFDLMVMGLEELLRYADRNAMAHSREVRLPFLQYQLVQFVLSQPSDYRFRNGYTKWILRESMKNQLPKEIVWQKGKTGFEPPQELWMQDEAIRSLVQEGRKKLVAQKILSPKVLDKPIIAAASHAADKFDFRCMIAGAWLP
jgi:asparagine synthase (glutamine-hydrolysing)